MKLRSAVLLLVFPALGVLPSAGLAHSVGRSALQVSFEAAQGNASWRIALSDLDELLGLDSDRDRYVSVDEITRSSEAIGHYLLDRLEIEADAATCATRAGTSTLDGTYLSFAFAITCPAPPRRLSLRYDLFFDHDRSHSAQIVVEHAGRTSSSVIRADARLQRFDLGSDDTWQRAREYLTQGVWHIWTGYDHVLFLLTLLLPAVLVRRNRAWEGVPRFGVALAEVVKIVSAFTLAHSLTLSLAALGMVHLPSRWVEATIAASVCLAALNNLFGWVRRRLWIAACVFGLVHGFGFASVLEELGLPKHVLLVALLAFNGGVELGQLAIVLAFLPVAFALRRSRGYVGAGLIGGSIAIAGLGFGWLIERALDVSLAQAFAILRQAPMVPALLVAVAAVALVLAGVWRVRAAARAERDCGHARVPGDGDPGAERTAVVGTGWRYAQSAQVIAAWLVFGASLACVVHLVQARIEQSRAELAARVEVAQAAMQRRDWPRAGEALAQAAQLAEALDDSRAHADALNRTGALHTARGELSQARTAHEQALALYAALGDDRAAAATHRSLGLIAQLASDLALAARAYRRALALHERAGLRDQAGRDALELAGIYRRSKQYPEAQVMYTQALAIGAERGDEQQIARLSAELGILHQLQAQPSAAGVWFGRAAALHESAQQLEAAASQYANLAGAQHAAGKIQDAAASYRRSLELFQQVGGDVRARRVQALLAELD